jgi:uncharacterized protein
MKKREPESNLIRAVSIATVGTALATMALEGLRLLFRNSQLFCPDKLPLRSWNPEDYGFELDQVDQILFESEDGTLLDGWYCRAKRPVASILFCHGNSGNLTWTAEAVAALTRAGLNVLTFDYRGFGRSSSFTTLSGVLADAHAAMHEHDRIRPALLPSILYGYSLGGAIAVQTADKGQFDGLILQSTFTNLQDMARLRYPRLPLHLVSGKEFDTLKKMEELQIPALVIHGAEDEVVPCWMGEKLFDTCSTPGGRLLVLDGALHTDLYERDAATIVEAIRKFATSLPEQTSTEVEPESETAGWYDRLAGTIRRSSVNQWVKRWRSYLPGGYSRTGTDGQAGPIM